MTYEKGLLADGVSPIRARNKVSQMFLVSVITVKRWSSSWEANGKHAGSI